MFLRTVSRRDEPRQAIRLGEVLLFAAGMALCGCGSTVTNLLPDAAKATPGVPAGPTLGYVFSPSDGTLRALLGVRGSAQVSQSIVPAGVYVAGDASTASGAALLVDASGGLFAFDLPLSQPMHVADGLALNAQVSFSPSGLVAVVYAPGAATLTVVRGLPASPQSSTRSVPAAASLAAAAVSDAGNVVIAAQGKPMAVGTLSAAGAFSAVASASVVGGLSFLPDSDSLLVTDAGANTAALVRGVSSAPSVQALGVAGLNQPLAIAGSQDRNWAVIADGGDQNVFRVDLSGQTPAVKLACACQPAAVSALAGGGTFRVNGLYGGPLWTVDTTTAAPQLLFVPAIAKGSP